MEVYLDNDVVSALAKDDHPEESLALDRLLEYLGRRANSDHDLGCDAEGTRAVAGHEAFDDCQELLRATNQAAIH